MPSLTAPNVTVILVDLDHLGVQASTKAGQISLRPASRVPAELLEDVCDLAAEMMTLLAAPRCRWRQQAEALIAGHPDDECEDLLHLFDEREAIASVDGGQDDHHSGQLAYVTLKNHLREEA
jgi:hypothetical protein